MYSLKNISVLILAAWVAGSAALPKAGDKVTSGLPPDIQPRVDSGELSCIKNSNGQTACSDQFGASFIVRDAGGKKNSIGSSAGASGNARSNADEGNQTQAEGQPGDPVTDGLPADIQAKVDKGTLDCKLNTGLQTVCADQFGASFIVVS
ncbi:hypothetical protein ColLi_10565 [Colletotrichum liriopes]|uniref:Uncharacterized protein n=1 Tax=Colletotrichum liriopes TaxID=708192 RepID=A0AA37GVF4_9PEZI|nr:hypothetical protein ColLi_10565 [Colletotrichum liriopes]